jgi:hypothetical protein
VGRRIVARGLESGANVSPIEPDGVVPFWTDFTSNFPQNGVGENPYSGEFMTKDTITLAGTIRKIVDRSMVNQPQRVQIFLEGADALYNELRIPNVHNWNVGKGIEVTIRPL